MDTAFGQTTDIGVMLALFYSEIHGCTNIRTK